MELANKYNEGILKVANPIMDNLMESRKGARLLITEIRGRPCLRSVVKVRER
jgi:hypothetical protein